MESTQNRRTLRSRSIIAGGFCVLCALLYQLCGPAVVPDGEALATRICAACHQYPEPALLDKRTWDHYILPRMGAMLGHYSDSVTRASLLAEGGPEAYTVNSQVWPDQPLISQAEWDAIREFYLSEAPTALTTHVLPASSGEPFGLFKPGYPAYLLSPPSTSYVHISERGTIEIADVHTKGLYAFDRELKLIATAEAGEGIVSHIYLGNENCYVVMGSFAPGDQRLGEVIRIDDRRQILINQLARPVHINMVHPGEELSPALVICEYGKWSGALSLWTLAQGAPGRTNLIERSGAISTAVEDFDRDGDEDIVALFGQGDEGFWLFENHNGVFSGKQLLQFSAAHGSTGFVLEDVNGDGRKDLVYTAGDGADYPAIVKPYHGIYIFLASEDGSFVQHEFLPLPGAYRAIPGDFDGDGDLDIAAISFFPDYASANPQSFVFYESKGGRSFEKHTIDITRAGRWMVMESGDYDLDGDLDLVLGSLVMEVPGRSDLVEHWTRQGIPFMVLENQSNP